MKFPEFSLSHPAGGNRSAHHPAEQQKISKMASFNPGHILTHFRIQEKIAEGGMGVVYKALDLNLQRPVALKFLPPHLSAQAKKKQQFLAEARLISSLDHPYICTVHEIFETDDQSLVMVMPCYNGRTLRDYQNHKGLNQSDAIAVTKQIACGLAKAHGHDIVHQDVKPDNIIVTDDDIVKIIDFGIAKLANGKNRGDISGTAAYMSPEQLNGGDVDQRTDIWSLGVLFYEMLSGKLPFDGEYEQVIVYSIIKEEPQPLKNVSKGLQQIVFKCLSKNPAERYQSMRDLMTAIEIHLAREKYATRAGKEENRSGSSRLFSGVAFLTFGT